MDRKLWNAIHDVLDAAEYALRPLDNHSDLAADENGVMTPNDALRAHALLSETIETLGNMMPPCPETPAETAVSRAEYMEDR